MKKKHLFTSLIALALAAAVQAVPVAPAKKVVTLPSGEKVEMTAVGDEFFHCWKGSNGKSFRLLSDGNFEEIPAAKLEAMMERGRSERTRANAERVRKQKRKVGTITSGLKGTKRGLVILMEFTNLKFSVVDNPRTFWYRMFNEQGFHEYAFKGSVRDYFLEQSYGEFAVDFDVVGPYTTKYASSYYGRRNGDAHDNHVPAMAWEAMQAADPDVNYRNYDWDGDGEVEQVYIIYAGYGENYSGNSEDYIWAHTSSVKYESDGKKLDGMIMGTYACNCEIQGYESMVGKPGYEERLPEGIGSACHEFSHCLGYPDFYDTNTGSGTSMAEWDVLDGGCYNGRMYKNQRMMSVSPACYTAYERMAAGWLEPIELKEETRVEGMKALNSKGAQAYIMYNDRNRNEYFLLENRQQIGFDEALPAHGLLMTHVTYDEGKWNGNSVNTDPDKLCMQVVPADNSTSPYNCAGDVFPGSTGRTSITDRDGALLNTRNADGTYYLHKAVEQIAENANGEISFLALRPDLLTPEVKAEVLSTSSFKATWSSVERATEYELELMEYAPKGSPEEALLLQETFAKCYKSSAGFSDISSSLNSYTDVSGFRGSALYQSPYKLKVGTTTKTGYLYSPVQNATSTGSITVVLGVRPGTIGTPVKGVLDVLMNTRGNERTEFEFSEEGYLVFHPTIITDDLFRVDLMPEGLMYLSYLAVYDGNFTAEELGLKALNAKSAAAEAKAFAPVRKVKSYRTRTTELSYTFTDLSIENEYEVRVRALDDREGEWSDAIRVKLFDVTAIHDVKGDHESVVRDGVYYDLSGRRVTGSDAAMPLRPGLYIRNGRKISVK